MRFFALLALLAAPAAAQEWRIDPAHSAAQFAVRHMMVSTVRGHFGTIRGTASYNPADAAKSSITVEVDAASIDTRNAKRDAHLKSADFFDVEKHPTLRFQSRSVEPAGGGRLKLTGDLTIRGVTRPVTFDVDGMSAPVRDGRGGERIGATAAARISRKDFGMTWNRAIEAGGVTVGDEVSITVDLQLIRKLPAQ